MKLANNFFQIKEKSQSETVINFTIEFNTEHFIYQSHFPENPITPGVCIIQIIKELAEEILGYTLFLKKIQTVKFLNVINPIENKKVTFLLSIVSENDNHKVDAVVNNKDCQFAKLTILLINKTEK
jgi:3-hydroxyacyl-[acyl-carrier-protein] dehydratase